jgi:hypothetical protein
MDKPFYDFRIEDDACQFSFTSTGPRPVNKLVLYSATNIPNLYNLSLADVEADGSPNYNSVRNNGDLTQLMATVAQTMLAFFERHPQALVAFSGNTPSRTRLYQIVLARELQAASKQLVLLGLQGTRLVSFEPNQPYDGFVISLAPTEQDI